MSERKLVDVAIVGAGPAGMTAAIYCKRAGYNVVVLEKEVVGGKITLTPEVENIPGFVKISGMEFALNMSDQLERLEIPVEYCEVTKVERCEKCGLIKVDTDDENYKAKSVILATGTKNRTLGLENEEKLIGRGISFCATCDGPFYKDKNVAVVGGGNSAITEALELAEICGHVTILQDLPYLTAEQVLQDKLKEHKNINILLNTKVKEYDVYKKNLQGLKIECADNDLSEVLVDGVFLAIGMIPNTDAFKSSLNLDGFNYIEIDKETNETSISGVFACGDCTHNSVKQVAVACGDGAKAAIKAVEFLKK